MDTPVSGTPCVLLRVEGLVMLIAAVVGYHAIGTGWGLLALSLLLPDLGILGYLAGPRTGAFAYNAVHTYFGPAGLATLAYLGVVPRAWLPPGNLRMPPAICAVRGARIV